jgi:hypothetical protein
VAALTFSDQSRMSYSATVPPRQAGEFIITVADDDAAAEFTVVLYSFRGAARLAPQIRAFGDATASLTAFIAVGGLKAIETDVVNVEEFSRRLLDLGLTDVSERPLGGGQS